jgi:hypothetical protein
MVSPGINVRFVTLMKKITYLLTCLVFKGHWAVSATIVSLFFLCYFLNYVVLHGVPQRS